MKRGLTREQARSFFLRSTAVQNVFLVVAALDVPKGETSSQSGSSLRHFLQYEGYLPEKKIGTLSEQLKVLLTAELITKNSRLNPEVVYYNPNWNEFFSLWCEQFIQDLKVHQIPSRSIVAQDEVELKLLWKKESARNFLKEIFKQYARGKIANGTDADLSFFFSEFTLLSLVQLAFLDADFAYRPNAGTQKELASKITGYSDWLLIYPKNTDAEKTNQLIDFVSKVLSIIRAKDSRYYGFGYLLNVLKKELQKS